MEEDAYVDAYVTLTEANEYLSGHLYADAWTKADNNKRSAALVTATRRIDMQPLRRSWSGRDDAPQAVKDACVEEALALLTQGDVTSKTAARVNAGLLEKRVGDASEVYDIAHLRETTRMGVRLLSPEARALLAPYRVGPVSIV